MVVNHSHRMQSKIFRFLLFHCCPPTYCGALYKCLRQVTCIHYLTVVLLPYVHTCNSPLMHPYQGLLLSIPLKRRKKEKKKTNKPPHTPHPSAPHYTSPSTPTYSTPSAVPNTHKWYSAHPSNSDTTALPAVASNSS